MSYNTKIVVFVGSPADDDTARVVEALGRYAEGHPKAAHFKAMPDHVREILDGHGETIVGSVNHLDADTFLDMLRDAARHPQMGTSYAPLVVILRGDDDDDKPRTQSLDWDGNWS